MCFSIVFLVYVFKTTISTTTTTATTTNNNNNILAFSIHINK